MAVLSSRSPAWIIQKAVFSRLDTDLPEPVYDHVPDGSAYPYVVIGDDAESSWNTKQLGGVEVELSITVYAQYRGWRTTKELADSVIASMTGVALDLSTDSFSALAVIYDGSQQNRHPDGITREIELSFRVKVQDIT